MKVLTSLALFWILIVAFWFLHISHQPVETVQKLWGRSMKFALKQHFKKAPDETTSFRIDSNLNELQGGILVFKNKIKDSTIKQYTWTYWNYKVTIWTARTANQDEEIIDAIRYNNSVQF